jgi:membrane-associated phospholipid phosphatase
MSHRGRWAVYILAVPLVWLGTVVLGTGYVQLRSWGATTLPWNDGAGLEHAVFHFDAPRLLQSHIYARDVRWLDYSAFLLHASWFFLPILFGVVVTVFERRRMMEYFGWLLVASYIACTLFVLFPVTPPWMEPGVQRVLLVRSFVEYAQLDDNPVAAFPSLHAGLPMTIALFFLLRCERARIAGWFAMAFALAIGVAVVYLGEHWIVDVLGGWALAGGVAGLFVSKRVRALMERFPGNPLGFVLAADRLLNERPSVPETREPSALPVPAAESEAA